MTETGIVAQILITYDKYKYLKNCAKKLEALQKEQSAPKRSHVDPTQISSSLQKGFGIGDDDGLKTIPPTLIPPENGLPNADDTFHTSNVRPIPSYRPFSQFVQYIKPKWRKKARLLLHTLAEHPDKISWEINGDVEFHGEKKGNLHHLLALTYYGSRRIPVAGDEEWFKLLSELKLDKQITNKSNRAQHEKRINDMKKPFIDDDDFSGSKFWYKLVV
jgi:hypothetical protein